jgi:DNA-binding transcriptional regulator LsrR (DeoR family)
MENTKHCEIGKWLQRNNTTHHTILNPLLYGRMTQTEIAALGFPQKVNRLLLQAREGVCYITIRTPFQQLFEMEDRLKAVFGLQEAIVIPAVAESGSSPLNALGIAAADFLLAHLRDGDVMGIGGGSAVNAVVQAIAPARSFNVEVCRSWSCRVKITTDVNCLALWLTAGRQA